MKRVFGLACVALALCAAILGSERRADAAFILRIQASGLGAPVFVTDDENDGGGDDDELFSSSGAIQKTYVFGIGTIDGLTVNIAQSKPLIPAGPDTFDQMHLTVVASSSVAGSWLQVDIVDTGFTQQGSVPIGPGAYQLVTGGATSGGASVTNTGYLDATDSGAFETGLPIAFGPATGAFASDTFLVHGGLSASYSMGMTTRIDFASAGSVSSDSFFNVYGPEEGPLVPEPASLAVWGGLSVLGLLFGRRFGKKSA